MVNCMRYFFYFRCGRYLGFIAYKRLAFSVSIMTSNYLVFVIAGGFWIFQCNYIIVSSDIGRSLWLISSKHDPMELVAASLIIPVAASLISLWLLWWSPAESHYSTYDHSAAGYVSHAHCIVLLYYVGNKITTATTRQVTNPEADPIVSFCTQENM